MWVFLNNSFVSAVESYDDPDMLVVRARVKGDLERFFGAIPINVERHEDRDYLFRTTVTKDRFADVLVTKAQDIDYTNYKNSIEDQDYAVACSEVWAVMNDLQGRKHGSGLYVGAWHKKPTS